MSYIIRFVIRLLSLKKSVSEEILTMERTRRHKSFPKLAVTYCTSAFVNPIEHLKMQSLNCKVMVPNNTLSWTTNTLIWRHDGLIRKKCNCRSGLMKVLLAGTSKASFLLHPAHCASARRCHGWASSILVLHRVAIPRWRVPAVFHVHKTYFL